MKKFSLIFALLVLIIPVKALEKVPTNIYYLNDGLYAYLEEADLEFDEETETKYYVEYRLTNGEEIKNVDLIEITNLPAKNLLLESTDEFLSEGIEIESRFILYNEKYDYSEWTEKEKITTFDFEEIPTPSITDLKSDLTYNLENEEEISDFFQVFSKINEKEITYKTEYKFNDQTWKEEKEEFDTNDAKVEVRIKYQIGEYESKYSNVLVYEKHPEKVCPFDSDICCNEFANISLCYWLIIIFFVITGLIILIERKKRLKREA